VRWSRGSQCGPSGNAPAGVSHPGRCLPSLVMRPVSRDLLSRICP
jgi:hypothetical protein